MPGSHVCDARNPGPSRNHQPGTAPIPQKVSFLRSRMCTPHTDPGTAPVGTGYRVVVVGYLGTGIRVLGTGWRWCTGCGTGWCTGCGTGCGTGCVTGLGTGLGTGYVASLHTRVGPRSGFSRDWQRTHPSPTCQDEGPACPLSARPGPGQASAGTSLPTLATRFRQTWESCSEGSSVLQ